MELVAVCTIQNECVAIDGKSFVDCILINCILEYSGDPASFVRTRMRGCRYVFFGPARHTVQFLQGTRLMPHNSADWAEFGSEVHRCNLLGLPRLLPFALCETAQCFVDCMAIIEKTEFKTFGYMDARSSKPNGGNVSEFSKLKVLVADDEQVIANTLAVILNQAGFEARAVYSGE